MIILNSATSTLVTSFLPYSTPKRNTSLSVSSLHYIISAYWELQPKGGSMEKSNNALYLSLSLSI